MYACRSTYLSFAFKITVDNDRHPPGQVTASVEKPLDTSFNPQTQGEAGYKSLDLLKRSITLGNQHQFALKLLQLLHSQHLLVVFMVTSLALVVVHLLVSHDQGLFAFLVEVANHIHPRLVDGLHLLQRGCLHGSMTLLDDLDPSQMTVGVHQLLGDVAVLLDRVKQVLHGPQQVRQPGVRTNVEYEGGVGGDRGLHEHHPVHLDVVFPGGDGGEVNKELKLLEVGHVVF